MTPFFVQYFARVDEYSLVGDDGSLYAPGARERRRSRFFPARHCHELRLDLNSMGPPERLSCSRMGGLWARLRLRDTRSSQGIKREMKQVFTNITSGIGPRLWRPPGDAVAVDRAIAFHDGSTPSRSILSRMTIALSRQVLTLARLAPRVSRALFAPNGSLRCFPGRAPREFASLRAWLRRHALMNGRGNPNPGFSLQI